MRKKDVLNLIKYHCQGNDIAFRDVASAIASDFYQKGELQLGEYIMAQLSDANVFLPQDADDDFGYISRIATDYVQLLLPETINHELSGISNALARGVDVGKFLFQGSPGTGKTESVKLLAHELGRELYSVDFNSLVDSKLGQTAKNIQQLFLEMKSLKHPERAVFLFDEIDVIALDRINARDVREMGRVTSAFLKELDALSPEVIVFATTNLYASFDKALIRRFDAVVDFNRYTQEDLIELSCFVMESFCNKYSFIGKDMRLFKKILSMADNLPYPGEMKNLLKSSVAFSSVDNPYDYLARIFRELCGKNPSDVNELKRDGFTLREIERLSAVSKSTVARLVKGGSHESAPAR